MSHEKPLCIKFGTLGSIYNFHFKQFFFHNFMATTQSPDAQNLLLRSKTNMPIQEKSYLAKLENTDKHFAHWVCFHSGR